MSVYACVNDVNARDKICWLFVPAVRAREPHSRFRVFRCRVCTTLWHTRVYKTKSEENSLPCLIQYTRVVRARDSCYRRSAVIKMCTGNNIVDVTRANPSARRTRRSHALVGCFLFYFFIFFIGSPGHLMITRQSTFTNTTVGDSTSRHINRLHFFKRSNGKRRIVG